MANRINIFGDPGDRDTKRLKREMNVMTVEYELVSPAKQSAAKRRMDESITPTCFPVVEVLRQDNMGSVYLTNPDEPTLRQCLYSEGILSITSYWV